MNYLTLAIVGVPVVLLACNPKPVQGPSAAEAPSETSAATGADTQPSDTQPSDTQPSSTQPSSTQPSGPPAAGAAPSSSDSASAEPMSAGPMHGETSTADSLGASAPAGPAGPRCTRNFTEFDADGDQRVSLQEFLARPHAFSDAESIFRARDRDGDGSLVADEFCSGWRPGARAGHPGPGMGPGRGPGMGMGPGGGRGPGAGPRCEAHFERFDGNGDGKVSEREFASFPHPHADPHAVFVARDQNGDGLLSMAEFCSRWSVPPRP